MVTRIGIGFPKNMVLKTVSLDNKRAAMSKTQWASTVDPGIALICTLKVLVPSIGERTWTGNSLHAEITTESSADFTKQRTGKKNHCCEHSGDLWRLSVQH